MRVLLTLTLIPVLTLSALACDGGDDEEATPTAVASIAAPTEVAESPTPAATATSEPEATETPVPTNTPAATATPAGPPFSGSTDPVSFESEPAQPDEIFILTDVRVGAHPESGGYDRIVFEFEDAEDGAHPAGSVEYVDEASQCGSGEPVEVEGGAILAVRFDFTQAHDEGGNLTIDAIEVDGPGNSLVQAVSYCDFEGVVQWALGVPSELDFNVTFLEDTSRVVIDIQWP